mmetsp:Transcript_8972/g.14172  ORF Transcript_8972/g.14172 Transcript_8972/m.14172 type:complete len:90 (+) Transcript_8972:19-288(+)
MPKRRMIEFRSECLLIINELCLRGDATTPKIDVFRDGPCAVVPALIDARGLLEYESGTCVSDPTDTITLVFAAVHFLILPRKVIKEASK